MYEELQNMYRESNAHVRPMRVGHQNAEELYGEYVSFVKRSAEPSGRLLDVGCGNGWSAYLFSQSGYQTVGVDLNAKAFESLDHEGLSLKQGSAMDLPFADESFNVVAANQMLEHTPDPGRVLSEMLRVLKPNGVICIVGPNLLSLGDSVRGITTYVWRNRPIRRIFMRDASMSRHPSGNTLFEVAISFITKTYRILNKSFNHHVSFDMRTPDLVPPFHADNDACYLCNPIDVSKFLVDQGCRIIQNGKYDRSSYLRLLASGTWIAAVKSGQNK